MKAAVLLLAILSTAGIAPAQSYLNCHFAPGWEQSGAVHQYTADNLYEYKDGGAEGYLLYGFVRMQGIDCKSGGDTLTIDVSEMKDADLAWGIFSANVDPNMPIVKLGMSGQVGRQSGSFARGNYYVEMVVVAANPDSDLTAPLKAFAGKIAENLAGRDSLPEPLAFFDPLNVTSLHLIPESVLGIRQLKLGYVAKYKQGQAFIVQEATAESAAEVLKSLRARFDPSKPAEVGDEAIQAKVQYLDGICIFRKGRYIAGYANLPEPADAVAQAARLAARIP
jgi:hypothetical protein